MACTGPTLFCCVGHDHTPRSTAAVSVQMFHRVRDKNVIPQVVTLLAGTEIST